jgi:hypothetical protein
VLEPGGGADLPEEPFGAETLGQVGVEDLEGDGTVVAEVVREIHRGHPALAQLAVEDISGTQ